MRTVRPLVLCLLLAGALALPAPTAEARSPGHSVVKYVNKYRAKHGKPPLRPSRSLWRSSGRYAFWIMRHDRFGHRARISAPRKFRAVGETLALCRGWRLRTRRLVRRWMRSRYHRGVLLSRRFNWIGVGRWSGRYRGRRATAWVVHVGRL